MIPKRFPLIAATKPWYILLLSGIALITGGIYIHTAPAVITKVWAIVFSIWLIASGCIEAVLILRNTRKIQNRQLHFLFALLTAGLGIYLIINTGTGIVILSAFMALFVLFKALQALILYLSLKKLTGHSKTGLLILGVAGIVFAITLISRPQIISASIALISGIGFIFAGGIAITVSLFFKKISKKISILDNNEEFAEYEIVEENTAPRHTLTS